MRTPWLDDAPGNWDVRRFAWLGKWQGGGTPSKAVPAYWDGDIPWVSPKDMKARRINDTIDHVSQDGVRESSTNVVPAESIVIVVRSGILRHSLPVAITSRPMAINQDLKALQPEAGIDASFVAYWIEAHQKSLLSLWRKGGTTVESLETDLIRETSLPLPPHPQQRDIASFLDCETGRIDTLIGKKRRLLDLLDEKRTALITRAVTQGLDPDVPLKDSKVEWIGEIPEHWEVVRVKRLTPPGRAITYGIVQAGPHVPDGIPYIRTSDMAGDSLPVDGYQRTSKAIDAQYARSRVHPGDVVVAIRATLGKSLLVPNELPHANLTQGTARVVAGSRVLPAFVQVGLSSSHTQQRFNALAKGATFQEITLRMLRELEFCVPPLEEQTAILEHLDREMGQFSTLRSSIKRGIKLLQEYRAAVISAAVTGNIDVRQQVAV